MMYKGRTDCWYLFTSTLHGFERDPVRGVGIVCEMYTLNTEIRRKIWTEGRANMACSPLIMYKSRHEDTPFAVVWDLCGFKGKLLFVRPYEAYELYHWLSDGIRSEFPMMARPEN